VDRRVALEGKLVELLASNTSRGAKDYICRLLVRIGSGASVPTLAKLLADKDNSHMARYALERISASQAGDALRSALGSLEGALKLGVIASLGARRDEASVSPLAALVASSDQSIARAAALALGAIKSASAAKALTKAPPASGSNEVKQAVTDASLACAEGLLTEGNKTEALALYKSLAGESQPKHVRLAATRGMLACAGKKE
jgi:HEAT repeat protein